MITELERYHGVVLRQLLVEHGQCLHIGVANLAGRVDVFCVEGAAFQVKYSSKRLQPWHFTYIADNIHELSELRRTFSPVWAFLVCGQDGVVGISVDELISVMQPSEGGAAWVRISRSRNEMYRVTGSLGELPRAKPRGVKAFLTEVFHLGCEAQSK